MIRRMLAALVTALAIAGALVAPQLAAPTVDRGTVQANVDWQHPPRK